MAQVTGKKVATTPMPTPTGTSGAIIDSFNTQDDKTVNAPSIHIVEDAITTINDNLSKTTISTDTRIALTYNTEYTTLTDGYFRIAVNGIASSHIVAGYINGVTVMALCGSGTNSQFMSLLVRKGTKIKYNGDNSSSGDGYFYPLS